jgi:hypothetical protein
MITGDGANVPRYSFCKNIKPAYFPLTYSDSADGIPAAASTEVCGARCWKFRDVEGLHLKLLVVKKK